MKLEQDRKIPPGTVSGTACSGPPWERGWRMGCKTWFPNTGHAIEETCDPVELGGGSLNASDT